MSEEVEWEIRTREGYGKTLFLFHKNCGNKHLQNLEWAGLCWRYGCGGCEKPIPRYIAFQCKLLNVWG